MSDNMSCASSIGYGLSELDLDTGSIHEDGHYVNFRGDTYSEGSSDYHLSEKADPNSKMKKHVRRFNPDKRKNVRVDFFPTNTTPNSKIKHAITGIQQSVDGRFFRTGTRDEDLFFSVILATGELGSNAPVLFYESPEQYERHFFVKLSQQIKNKWYEKQHLAVIRSNLKPVRESGAETQRGTIIVK